MDANLVVDTGADVSVVPDTVYRDVLRQPERDKSRRVLKGPNQQELGVLGVLHDELTFQGRKVNAELHVVKDLEWPLLSRKPDTVPFALTSARRVPVALLPKVKAKLQAVSNDEVIERGEEPTDWCSGMVVVPKTNGHIRICVDLTELNKYVKREVHPHPINEHVFAQMSGAKVFNK
ncbi:uncharacterized protein LOC135392372 [Ornithodoros turicata]|uniref:uncharacterized protein LOC135392372 n=1 Tax=Ornithodoros turicata TaxID=34597 RepID=UPI0031386C71